MTDSDTIHRLLHLLCYAKVMAIVIINFGVSIECEIESLLVFLFTVDYMEETHFFGYGEVRSRNGEEGSEQDGVRFTLG